MQVTCEVSCQLDSADWEQTPSDCWERAETNILRHSRLSQLVTLSISASLSEQDALAPAAGAAQTVRGDLDLAVPLLTLTSLPARARRPLCLPSLYSLAIGAPLSALSTLVQKVTAINAKHGPFDACLVAGDLFKEDSDGSELDGISLPVPTYFTVGKHAFPKSVEDKLASTPELAPNLVFIGKTGVFTTAQGLKVAVVGGAFDEAAFEADDNTDPNSPFITKTTISTLLSNPIVSPEEQASSLEAAKEQASALPSAFHGVDVLLTTSPPPALSLLSPSFPGLGFPLAAPAPPLLEVVKRTRPRYLFWADGPGFWEREPWGWTGPGGKEERWTRAIKLGALGAPSANGKPARWFYATTLPPQTPSTPLPTRPSNATPNPLTMSSNSTSKRAAPEHEEAGQVKKARGEGPPPEDYVCKICQVPGHWIQDCPVKAQKPAQDSSKPPPGYTCNICKSPDHFIRECPQREAERQRGPKPPPAGYVCRACGAEGTHYIRECPVVKERDQERSRRKELGPEECWFCLSNPKVTKHLIVAIGSETYVTLPKGQLIPTAGEKPLVPGGGHVLIIPIAHHPTLLSIPAADAMNIVSELESYKSALRSCYAKYGAVPVVFEVGRLAGKGGHAHIQIVPVPKELADKVADGFIKAGEASGLDWEAEPERALARVGPTGNYFKVECPDGRKLVHLLKGNFDLQFGRLVLSGLLGLHHRINWKDTVLSEAEEKEDAAKFKKALQPFLPQ
ncbi:hypothetical protein VHUM_04026 [Vanrija humicola]|uniref:CCHC-type domain-containing protein n=1 Tax=Vanrija humicola TaxID=5417 RepID=A0A7D8Z0N1_VANHU|nr:hypothetical protein VHUM_04026 [Vanrija humicola]